MADTNDTTTNSNSGTNADDASVVDKLTNTTAEDRADFLSKAQETLSGAVATAVEAVKSNPKTAAAVAVGATAVVAGAAFGATKLSTGAKGKTGSSGSTKAKSTSAKPTGTAKK